MPDTGEPYAPVYTVLHREGHQPPLIIKGMAAFRGGGYRLGLAVKQEGNRLTCTARLTEPTVPFDQHVLSRPYFERPVKIPAGVKHIIVRDHQGKVIEKLKV